MKLSTAAYGIRNLDSRKRATSGRWWILIAVVAVVACVGISALYCNNCQSNAEAALKASGDPDAWICNYNCDTTACGVVGATCQYNICTKTKPEDADDKPEDANDTNGGNSEGGK